jgi:hypothetical protein
VLSRKEQKQPMKESGPSMPQPAVATKTQAPATLPFHTMLWRAGSKTKDLRLLDKTSGKISLNAIGTFPGDFSGIRKLAYFTPQRETADRYAQWTKEKVPIENIVITQVAVPETLTNNLSKLILYASPNKPRDWWKQVVWSSRRGEYWPKELETRESDSDLIIGHIASGLHAKFEKMKDWTAIKDNDILRVQIDDETKFAMQWVFNNRRGEEAFQEQCQGKVWFHFLGALKTPPGKPSSA